ncbi:hypothetical protein KR018_001478 [Drosophila ironensis]|nr:hypothetical protein KR018_001478 [Drosophila ironensis]
MLSTTMPQSQSPVQAAAQPQSQSQTNTDASGSTSASAATSGVTVAIGGPSSPMPVKNETFQSMSPAEQSKMLSEDILEKSCAAVTDKTSIIQSAASSGGNNTSDGKLLQSSCSASKPIVRQNSLNSVNSCLVTSPNTSEHSNSSSMSAAAISQQIVDSDLVQQEEHAKKKKIGGNDEETEKITTKAKSLLPGPSSAALPVLVAIKEEPADVLNSLVTMKKEERDNRSPSMSPVGFGSIGNAQEISVKNEINNCNTEKSSTALALSNDDMRLDAVTCNQLNSDLINDSLNNPTIATGISLGLNTSHATGLASSSALGNAPSGSIGSVLIGNCNNSAVSNCLDYMQQQNHIFVFSTQLANKGAESVLSGQFQTIIAYHCTQPATKSFLEDFFVKNPMKINKLQRHGSIGLPWTSVGLGGSISPNITNPASKIATQQHLHSKPSGSLIKGQFNPVDNIKRNAPSSGFLEQSNSIPNENDLMCWESGTSNNTNDTGNAANSNTRNSLDVNSTSGESHTIKLLEAAGVDLGPGTKVSDTCVNHENNIVSLQGVKVPDENLTPQQRQHREEQLAKIKKMNQFLFPENENAGGGNVPNQISKLPNDMIMGIASGGSLINPQLRQMHMPGNVKSEQINSQGSGLTEDVLLPVDVMADIGSVMGCNNTQKNSLQCGPNTTVSATTANSINVNMQCSTSGAPNNNLIGNSAELLPPFGNTSCNVNIVGSGTDVSKNLLNPEGLPHVQHTQGVAQMEWSKIQQQFFEERLKGTKARQGGGIPPQQQSSGTSGNQTNNQLRSLQGPPPPYHSTQRSASVPIASQSPNPSSPNNLSLPSPRTSGTGMGLPSNSPNMEGTMSGAASTIATVAGVAQSTTQASSIGVLSGSKNCFQGDAPSPSNHNPNRNRNNGSTCALTLNLNSNPSTPLSHVSPKELEHFGQTPAGDNIKNRRASPQGNLSPSNGLIETTVEPRFTTSSPSLIFSHHPHMQNNSGLNSYKMSNPNIQMERQTSVPGATVQFNRRSDNIPLNPNGTRPPPNKMTQNFDPISSLAQMSQQLTSCVSSMGSPAGVSIMGGPGSTDINIEHGMISGLDSSSIDAMTQSNCHSMINSLGQRMLNPKMCTPNAPPSFNPNSPNSVRDFAPSTSAVSGPANSPNFQGGVPAGARLVGRIPVNFGSNFNPNIQVKASTPNTIQYMPVRPQNSTNNNSNGASNVRMPPSLEFLQRYANPQVSSVTNGPPICPPTSGESGHGMLVGSGSMIINSSGEQTKIGNNSGTSNSLNFFQNCNQVGIIEEDGGLAGHDIGMTIGQPSMIRGMRPHGIRPHMTGPRLQSSANRHIQFPHGSDGLDCIGDTTAIFNNSACNSAGPAVFVASQQPHPNKAQNIKAMASGICQNTTIGGASAVSQGHMQLQGQAQPLIGPANNNIMTATGSIPPNGVSSINFVGPSSNDLKYAQQYHSFQQQLYATNTRSQQQQQMHQQHGNMITMPPNLSPNPAFFVNK